MAENYFEILNKIDVNGKTEKKNGLTYLSWAWAWAEVKKKFPDANYIVYENTLPNGYVINYFTDGKTGYVKTGVIINGIEHIEYLPIMDYRNKSIPFDSITSFDVNKTIQRSLTKAVARHGLGLYIYAGEDLPEDTEGVQNPTPNKNTSKGVKTSKTADNSEIMGKEEMIKMYGIPYMKTKIDEELQKVGKKFSELNDTEKKQFTKTIREYYKEVEGNGNNN